MVIKPKNTHFIIYHFLPFSQLQPAVEDCFFGLNLCVENVVADIVLVSQTFVKHGVKWFETKANSPTSLLLRGSKDIM